MAWQRFSGGFVLCSTWAVTLAGATAVLHRYESTPGPTTNLEAGPVASTHKNTIIVFAHPKCPCTAATLRNFELVHELHPEFRIEFALVIPGNAPKDFAEGPTVEWQKLHAWASLFIDQGGTLARSLGATTSGHVMLFNSTGHCTFSGGITRSRGTSGEGTSLRKLLSTLGEPQQLKPTTSEVYGCSLMGE